MIEMEMKMPVPAGDSLIRVAWHIARIVDALNEPTLLSRWNELWNEPEKFPPFTWFLFGVVWSRAQRELVSARDQWIASERKGQGERVHLRPDWLRDPDYFVAHYLDASKSYSLLKGPGTWAKLNRLRGPFADSDFGLATRDLREWVARGEVEIDGVKGVRTEYAPWVQMWWSECSVRAFDLGLAQYMPGWDAIAECCDGCSKTDDSFRGCDIAGALLPAFYHYLMAYYDKQAAFRLESQANDLSNPKLNSAALPDYSKLRTEVLESLYPADQLLALYMLQRAQDGDTQAAHRIVMAYAPAWKSVAASSYRRFGGVDTKRDLEDIINDAYCICVSTLMGHSLDTVEAARGRESPYSVEDIITLLNPQKLKERWEVHATIGPKRVALATFIYILNRTLGNEPGNAEPILTPGSQGSCLPLGSPGQLDVSLNYCAAYLFSNMVPELNIPNDPWVNSNRFDPAKAKWNLGGFFRKVVGNKLQDIYEKESSHQVKGKRVPVAALSLDKQKDADGETHTLIETLEAPSDVAEEVLTSIDVAATAAALNEVRKQLSAADRALLDRMRVWIDNHDGFNKSQLAKDLGIDRQTVSRLLERMKPLFKKAGYEN